METELDEKTKCVIAHLNNAITMCERSPEMAKINIHTAIALLTDDYYLVLDIAKKLLDLKKES